jgi:hypothetical protein
MKITLNELRNVIKTILKEESIDKAKSDLTKEGFDNWESLLDEILQMGDDEVLEYEFGKAGDRNRNIQKKSEPMIKSKVSLRIKKFYKRNQNSYEKYNRQNITPNQQQHINVKIYSPFSEPILIRDWFMKEEEGYEIYNEKLIEKIYDTLVSEISKMYV